MLILGIDTSCDETAAAVLKNNIVISNLIYSQVKYHSEFGGVVPSIAKLRHEKNIDKIINLALKRAKISFKDLDAIAVTIGPGLAISLEVGIRKAKELSSLYSLPIIPINHMEGHLYSGFLQPKTTSINKIFDIPKNFPVLGILLSGGHSEFILVEDLFVYKKLGETLDDACGECFDKCARMLNLGYPGGKVLSKLADISRKDLNIQVTNIDGGLYVRELNYKWMLPVPMAKTKDYNLSFSGLKTAFSSLLKTIGNVDKNSIGKLCAFVEYAILYQVIIKLKNILLDYKDYFEEIWLGGGVIANNQLNKMIRNIIKEEGNNISIIKPYKKIFTGDNAAMIALDGYLKYCKYKKNAFATNLDAIDRLPTLDISTNYFKKFL